uniref:Aminoglycoside N(3)-acetyltransferase n=1 Tax=uncultured bacterium TaxID=77133 RepID=UPI000EF55C0F|nr:Chain A, Aminoglycoside N(3)-acetyltransferase [uncultured bacterium]6MN0_B Chain B, Aminoglycoside N(3)-acetyltransferase [uncultured bacterium]6MN0_C Chain C, Aminoglycoside N(3)-acetyltransferase [uncultured bacterium]6MN0_D Chain D, Aminoglycoside N(3)-acetyltransferase [uncultured bacterium]6MN0_E Chain E, Aminoglycoside N(3)-acetyltransferase [uncultured bacterium]6MN0_F Chain F, Aminoglycoside N(3)-acetyltransferase [uncultured bacterium]6MN1_A Chain A, Aminoglycoside N(3)-acetyltra
VSSRVSTRSSLAEDLRAIGLADGDAVLVHAALRKVGKIVGGPDDILDAMRDVIGPAGTVLGYADWQLEDEIRDDPAMREHIPAFDPLRSRSIRDNGFWPELIRTTPGALRSASPGASMAAIGGEAEWFTADHALDYGYGPRSPLGKLVEAKGKVLMLGAPLDTMTLLAHAEHLADFPNKRILRYEAPILVDGEKVWRWFEEFDTSDPPDGLADDYFAGIVEEFLATGRGKRGKIGEASSVLVPADEIVAFAVDWLERWGRTAR